MEDSGPIILSHWWRLLLEMAITIEIAWVSYRWLTTDLHNSVFQCEAVQPLALAWFGLCCVVQLRYIFAEGVPRFCNLALVVLSYPPALWSGFRRHREIRDKMVNGLLYAPPTVIFATQPSTRLGRRVPWFSRTQQELKWDEN